jgi:sRNA-binding carbon storage regulator CsrA
MRVRKMNLKEKLEKENAITIREAVYTMILKIKENKVKISIMFNNEINIDDLREIKIEKEDTDEKVVLKPFSITYIHNIYFLNADWSEEKDSEALLYFQYEDELLELLEELKTTKTLFVVFEHYFNVKYDLEQLESKEIHQ